MTQTFKELFSDDKWVKTFNRLNSDLLKSAQYFSSGVDPESVKDLDPETIQQCNEAYESLVASVKSIHALLESKSSVRPTSTSTFDSLQASNAAMIEAMTKNAQQQQKKDDEVRKTREESAKLFEEAIKDSLKFF